MTLLDAPAVTLRRQGYLRVTLGYAVALATALAVGRALFGQHPVVVAALADLAATAVVFAFSVAHDNSSFYDPYWSLAPIPIALYWASLNPDGVEARQLVACLLVTLWGLRLTANWVARWRGVADEDFRYQEIRERTGRWYWPASFLSIHLMPTAWVFLGLLPLYPAMARPAPGFGALDVLATAVTASAIAVEAVADVQLRRFLRTRRDGEAVLHSGLWALSRHPNYFGEVLFWWGVFLYGLAAAPSWWWTAIGPLSITLLFVLVSVPWMDRRMLSRHPAWAEQLRRTSSLVPWPRRTGP
jgi:steroid 5-alpha reductase family enzyme